MSDTRRARTARIEFSFALSAWMVPLLLAIGWGPLVLADLFLPAHSNSGMAFGMAWAFPAVLFALGAILSAIVQVGKLLIKFFQNGKQ